MPNIPKQKSMVLQYVKKKMQPNCTQEISYKFCLLQYSNFQIDCIAKTNIL